MECTGVGRQHAASARAAAADTSAAADAAGVGTAGTIGGSEPVCRPDPGAVVLADPADGAECWPARAGEPGGSVADDAAAAGSAGGDWPGSGDAAAVSDEIEALQEQIAALLAEQKEERRKEAAEKAGARLDRRRSRIAQMMEWHETGLSYREIAQRMA